MLRNNKICDRCGREIEEGGDFYEVEIVVKAGFDGVIKETDIEMDEVLKSTEAYSEEDLEKMVYERRKYVLCVRCKEVWMANPFLKPL